MLQPVNRLRNNFPNSFAASHDRKLQCLRASYLAHGESVGTGVHFQKRWVDGGKTMR
jgi:hypothetical protein